LKSSEVRFHELDAIRGLAALSVLFYHYEYMWLRVAHPSASLRITLGALYPLAAGHEAVLLFFVLSGFVLATPYLRGKGQPYFVFLFRRILRIYCPYLFALGLALIGASLFHGHLGLSTWASKTWSQPVNGRLVLQHILFIGNYDCAQYNTAFWSLVYEMRISIMFPLLFALIDKRSTISALFIAAVCVVGCLVLVGRWPDLEQTATTLQYVAVFICGIILAKNLGALSRWYHTIPRYGRVLLVFATYLVYTWSHRLEAITSKAHRLPGNVAALLIDWPIVLGALGIVMIGLNSVRARQVLNSPIPRFLGRISYSLYLIHGTVLFASAFLLTGRMPKLLILPIYVAAAIILATVFCITIEEPFLRLGRRIGGRNAAATYVKEQNRDELTFSIRS
jgi:peptidoglycan/LPS O-acetylase OafA/YrhL